MNTDEYRSLFYPCLSAFICGLSILVFVHLRRPRHDVSGRAQRLQIAQDTAPRARACFTKGTPTPLRPFVLSSHFPRKNDTEPGGSDTKTQARAHVARG